LPCVSCVVSHFLISFFNAFSFSASLEGCVIIVDALTVFVSLGNKNTLGRRNGVRCGAPYLQH
jgi:hypothetical protein